MSWQLGQALWEGRDSDPDTYLTENDFEEEEE